MAVLSSDLRKDLEKACVRGRKASEKASRAAIGAIGVLDDGPAAHLGDEDRNLCQALRAKRDQLGDAPAKIDLLAADCAYEQWHRLLFARFLAENGLLIHPQFKVPVTLAECDDLASDLAEPDAWAVAGRFAAEILPGIFRLDDPCVRLRLAPEGRLELEQIVEGIPAKTFAADDALGWVYQHWQKERKDEVNASERKIGGADLAPVTQLFTENYMVRFLLENSLGAWWASRHPDSPLLRECEFLRFDDDRKPAAGAFEGWPAVVAAVTVIDPCCGSGHFLVEAFGMLWRMRAEEETLTPVAAQDAVLRDNLFGLELDPRCVQIAMFAVAMAAWKAGGGWRELPVPNVACSGVPVKAPREEWLALANGVRVERALARLHLLFRDADSLGSLIDPKRTVEMTDPFGRQVSLDDSNWDELLPLLSAATNAENIDPATAVLGRNMSGVARAARLLSHDYTLVVTNVPYLTAQSQADALRNHLVAQHPSEALELATAFVARCRRLRSVGGTSAVVTPQGWSYQPTYELTRRAWWTGTDMGLIALLGPGAFEGISGEVVSVLLLIDHANAPSDPLGVVDVRASASPSAKSSQLKDVAVQHISAAAQMRNPDARLILDARFLDLPLLAESADSYYGLGTGDYGRFGRCFWEVQDWNVWAMQQSTVREKRVYGGREHVIRWEGGHGDLATYEGAFIRNTHVWGSRGVLVSMTGTLPATLYTGEPWDSNCAAVIPRRTEDLPAVWAFMSSDQYQDLVRSIDQSLKVMNHTLVKVPFDLDHWRAIAEADGPLPEPHSNDPTQWLFKGHSDGSTEPLQVAVARLLGYRWPEQPEDDVLDSFADADSIACLPSVLGEAPAADRLHELLAHGFRATWSTARATELLTASGAKKPDLDSWLRDEFFKAHCQVFKHRPFVWHVWDGRKDGFGALVNYHRLDRPTLERLTYTYLGDWIERQIAGARENVLGAAERLMAARELKQKLELILVGEPPYDIYVRWKPLAQQAIGWAPDLDDGVRLNVRPFVKAGVLRAKFNVKWEKDRGKNPDGSERHNDVHLTNAEKQAARGA
ncbi:MAG: DNA methyltransferase [Solirubrobacteraceae bacterium]